MLYQVLTRLIQRGQTGGLQTKLDLFYAVGRITQSEYSALSELLGESAQ